MAGQFIIPIGADTSAFEKALAGVQQRIADTASQIDKMSNKGATTFTKDVTANTKEYSGTIDRLKDSMNALVIATQKLETVSGRTGKAGQAAATQNYNQWANMRKQLQGATVDFEKIFQMQKRLSELSGKPFQTGSISTAEISSLPEKITAASQAFKLQASNFVKSASQMPTTNIDELRDKLYILQSEKKIYDSKNFAEAKAASSAIQSEINKTESLWQKTQNDNKKALQQQRKATIQDNKNALQQQRKEAIATIAAIEARDEKAGRARIARINQIKKNIIESEKQAADDKIYNIIKKPASTIGDYDRRMKELKELAKQYQGTGDVEVKAQRKIQRELIATQRQIDNLNKKKGQLSKITERLAKTMFAAFSVHQIRNFAQQVFTIGGELQKQRVALGAIVQDISKANILFSKLKVQALESPFTFKQLIDGTRQLAAYNIENEKLYKTQYMLTELSAGLGVEMNRLVLAYGQVRAASVLRGQELRQFTEAGIPLVQALADKFTALEGRVVSTGEVFERISNRMVSFKMVDEILQGLVQEGGRFYQMQAKQAATVAGQYANIRDGYEIMLLKIADSNEGFLVNILKFVRMVINNWEVLRNSVYAAGLAIAGYYAIAITSESAYIKMKQKMLSTLSQEQLIKQRILIVDKARAAFMGGLYTIAIAGAAVFVGWLWREAFAASNLNKEIRKLADTQNNTFISGATHLKGLISKLQAATVGSSEYAKAKQQIIEQYGDYFPRLIKETDGVKELSDMYSQATDNLRTFYAEKAREEAYEAVKSSRVVTRERERQGLKQTSLATTGMGMQPDAAKSYVNRLFSEIEILMLSGLSTGEIDFQAINKKILQEMGYSTQHANLIGYAKEYAREIEKSINTANLNVGKSFGILNTRILEINTSFNSSIDSIKENISKDENKIDFLKSLEINELDARKKVNEIRSKLAQTVQSILSTEGYEITDYQINLIARGATPSFAGISDNGQKEIQEAYNATNERIKQQIENVNSVESVNSKFFQSLAQNLNDRYQEREKLNSEQEKSLKLDDKATKTVWEQISAYKSLEDIKKSGVESYKTLQESYSTLSKQLESSKNNPLFQGGASAQLQEQLDSIQAQMKVWEAYFKNFPHLLDESKPEGTKTDNPEVERANRLLSIYRELNQAYKKYAEYKDDDYSKTQSMLEMQEEFNALNKEMGGRLGTISAVTSQEDLKKLIDDARSIFRTSEAQRILRSAGIKEGGGINVENAKKSFEELKKEADGIVEKLQPEFDNEEAISKLRELASQLTNMGKSGSEFAVKLAIDINKAEAERAVYKISQAVSKAENQYSVGKELKAIKDETGIDVSIPNATPLSFEQYIEKLQMQAAAYRAESVKGNAEALRKATELEMRIMSESAEMVKSLAIETAKMRYQMATNEERSSIKASQRERLQAELEGIDAQIAATEGSEKQKLEIKRAYINESIKLMDFEIGSLESEAFRMSSFFQIIYGDIGKYGQNTLKGMLETIKANTGAAQESGAVNGIYSVMGLDGKTIKINERDMGKFLADVDKKMAEIKSKNVFAQLKDDWQAIFEDGKFNPDKLGSVFSAVGNSLEGIGELAGIFGASQQTQDIIGGTVDAISAVGEIAANPYNVAAYLKLAKSIIQIGDADNAARIREHEQAISGLSKSYEKLSEELSESIGADGYNNKFAEMQQNLKDQEARYRQMAIEEEGKKSTDKAKVDEYNQKANDLAKQRLDSIKETMKEFSTDMESLSSQFTDAWITAFEETGDGLSGLQGAFDDVMKSILRKQIQARWMQAIVEPFLKQLNQAVDPTGEGGIAMTANEIDQIKNSFKEVGLGAQQANEYMESLYNLLGLAGGKNGYDTLQKGIQNITESSAQIIASYLNSVRLEVITIRTILESSYNSPQNASNGALDYSARLYELNIAYYPQYLDNLIAIRDNTAYLKDAYDPSKRSLRIS